MRVLLIGGAGLIGSALEQIFHEEGIETLVVDNFTSNTTEQADVKGQVVSGNATSFTTVNRAFAYFKPDVVYHFADHSYDQERSYDFQNESSTAINVADNICRCISLHGTKHVFFGSSGEVYKGGSVRPIKETSAVEPISYTGITKTYVEDLFRLASRQYGFGFTSLRFFQTYGNRKFLSPKHDVLTFFVDSLVRNEGIVIVGPNLYIDILHVTDAALASYIIFKSVIGGTPIDSVNIASGEGTKLIDLYGYLASQIESPHRRLLYKTPPRRQSRSLVGNNDLLYSLGWRPTVRLQDEVKELMHFREAVVNARLQ